MKNQLISILDEMNEQMELAKAELEKFVTKGNNSAGTRVRGHMQKIKSLAQDLRVGVQDAKNA